MPEISETLNVNDLPPHLVAPSAMAEAAQTHIEHLLTSTQGTPDHIAFPRAVGIEPRELLEELRAGRLTSEPHAAPRLTDFAAPAAPEAAVNAALAESPQAVETPDEDPTLEKHLIFSLGPVRYAVPLDHILEIATLTHYTPVPNLPEWVLGITNLRGDIVSLVDLNVLIGEATDEVTRNGNLLVVQTNAGDLTTCLVVDRVYGVVNVNPQQIQKLDRVANTVISSHTRGYFADGAEFLSLLDLESLLRALELEH